VSDLSVLAERLAVVPRDHDEHVRWIADAAQEPGDERVNAGDLACIA
jgi:hypothetical protein